MKDEMAYVVCLSCGSSFLIAEEFLPFTKFVCAECTTGKYVRLTAS